MRPVLTLFGSIDSNEASIDYSESNEASIVYSESNEASIDSISPVLTLMRPLLTQ